jgi:hypothetical protein
MSTSKTNKDQFLNITIVKELRDYSKDPYFVKKAEEAKAFIKKHGIPEDFKKKK